MNKKSIISLFLFAALVIASFSVVSGCKKTPAGNDGTAGSSGTVDTSEDRIYPNLPDETYKGYEFTFDQWDIDGWGMIQDISARRPTSRGRNGNIYTKQEDRGAV